MWSGLFAVVVSVAVFAAIAIQRRRRVPRWRWWGPPTFVLGWLLALGAVLSPLDRLGEQGSLSAHIAQHVILGDLAAPLLLIGLPPTIGLAGNRVYSAVTGRSGRAAHVTRLALSPMGALALWAAATYVWIVPPMHRQAVPGGFVHVLDHWSFLVFGLLVWLAAFDFRSGSRVRDWNGLARASLSCDLPWWARHVYAMVSRVAMLPAVAALWLASTSSYYLSSEPPPGALSQRQDQVRAASMMLGFEILLSGLAVVLAFIWVSVSEGRARERQGIR